VNELANTNYEEVEASNRKSHLTRRAPEPLQSHIYTGFLLLLLLIHIQSNCIGMDCFRKLYNIRPADCLTVKLIFVAMKTVITVRSIAGKNIKISLQYFKLTRRPTLTLHGEHIVDGVLWQWSRGCW